MMHRLLYGSRIDRKRVGFWKGMLRNVRLNFYFYFYFMYLRFLFRQTRFFLDQFFEGGRNRSTSTDSCQHPTSVPSRMPVTRVPKRYSIEATSTSGVTRVPNSSSEIWPTCRRIGFLWCAEPREVGLRTNNERGHGHHGRVTHFHALQGARIREWARNTLGHAFSDLSEYFFRFSKTVIIIARSQ